MVSSLEPATRRTRMVCLCLLTVVLGVLAVDAQGPDSQVPADARSELEQGRTSLDLGQLGAAKVAFDNCIQANARDAACYYGRARTERYLNQAEAFAHHSSAAERWLDAAIGDAQKAIALNDRFADAHALLADLYGQKITGAFSGMHYGPKANAECARAQQLDPNNAQAFAVLGRKYLYSPSMFGGDIDKAIDSFRKATEHDPRSDENFVWLAIVYRKKGDTADEQRALAEALRLNSRSVFAHRVQTGAE